MRIWLVSHYAVPRENSIGWRSQYIAKALAATGHEITVWAARRHHWVKKPCGEIPFEFSRDSDGYDFKTIDVPEYAGNGLGRLRNVRAFSRGMGQALKQVMGTPAQPDLMVISSPHPWVWPPLYNVAAGRVKMIFEERDIWPLSLIQIIGKPAWHPLVLWLSAISKRIYRQADALISLQQGAEIFLQSRGLPPEHFVYIPNGVDPEVFKAARPQNDLQQHFTAINSAKMAGKLAVIYAGAMGPPNALECLLELASLSGEKPYHFFLMGSGVSRASLEQAVASQDLKYITFLPEVKREESWEIIKAADLAFFSSLNVDLYKFGISFNKIFDYFMLKKPILGVIIPGQHPVGESGGGLEVAPGDPNALEEALQVFVSMTPEQRADMGCKGYEYVLTHHNWKTLGEKYAAVCESIVENGRLPVLNAASRCPAVF